MAEQERLIGERDQAMMESSEGSSAEQARLNQLMQERDSLLTQQQALQTDNDRVSSSRGGQNMGILAKPWIILAANLCCQDICIEV